jgi:hypothetical protein
MKLQRLHLFLILLLALVFCCCLERPVMFEGMSGNRVAVGSAGQPVNATTENTVDGIPSHQIPPGQKDLYILKSEVVPPVCPVCPSPAVCPSQQKCQPCPPCGRCPEPSFECKKVPNYNSTTTSYLPRPMMDDFSKF